jgi:N-acetylglucosamine kinase-like BadF-type ATPase
MRYFLGADLGGSRTRMVITDEAGNVVGYGKGGPGNHQSVGYAGMETSLKTALKQVLDSAKLRKNTIAGAGFGIAGYDWPYHRERALNIINKLGLNNAQFTLVNDAIIGLVAGAKEGWGVVVVSGTGCNCRGWDQAHKKEGRVTGYGVLMGEGAGASELVHRAMQLVGYSWTKRLPTTKLTDLFIEYTGAKDLEDLLAGYTEGPYSGAIGADAAPKIFEAAQQGDQVAQDLIHWAGNELGILALTVIRQLEFENLDFEVVLSGSMYEGGDMLIDPMRKTIYKVAPGAKLVRLTIPPVMGAVLLGMEGCGLNPTPEIRKSLIKTLQPYHLSQN